MSAGVWLVVAGGLLVFAMSFVTWGAYSENLGGGSSPWTWQFDVGVYQWTGLWPSNFPDWAYEGWRGWAAPGLYIASMLMTVLCVVAAIQALRRGLAGATVSGAMLRSLGIVALVVFIAYATYWATAPDWRTLCISDMAMMLGTVLIAVGGTLLGPAPPRTGVAAGCVGGTIAK